MDDPTRKYIERAIELSETQDVELSESDLAEIARELGLTAEDLARVEQEISDHIERGHGYSRHQLWDDAIREFEEACTLAPGRLEIRLNLAEAFAERGKATDYPDDKIRAEKLARSILEQAPDNDGAYRLLAGLGAKVEAPPPRPSTPAAANPARQMLLLFTAAGVVALGVVTSVVIYLAAPSPATVEHVVELPPIEEAPAAFEDGERELDVVFEPSEGLAFHTLRSRLANYPDRSFYTLWGDFEVVGDFEFKRIDAGVRLVDADGTAVKAYTREAWGTHEATLRKGDHGVFTMLLEAVPSAETVELSVTLSEKEPASGPYAEARTIEPTWSIEPPAHLQLRVGERHAEFDSSFLKDKGFFKAQWEFQNVGEVPIRALSYEVQLFDAQNKKIEAKRKIATFASNPPIGPGDTVLESTTTMLDASYDHYGIVITEIE